MSLGGGSAGGIRVFIRFKDRQKDKQTNWESEMFEQPFMQTPLVSHSSQAHTGVAYH